MTDDPTEPETTHYRPPDWNTRGDDEPLHAFVLRDSAARMEGLARYLRNLADEIDARGEANTR